MRWYGDVLKRDGDDVLRRALDFEVVRKKERRQAKMRWIRQVEELIEEIAIKREDATDRTKWRNAVCEHSRKMK